MIFVEVHITAGDAVDMVFQSYSSKEALTTLEENYLSELQASYESMETNLVMRFSKDEA